MGDTKQPTRETEDTALVDRAAQAEARDGSSSTTHVSTLKIGKRLLGGRFEILRRIGGGGMGVVYDAFDNVRKGRVALKTMNWLNAASIYHLKNEFRALADVHHPNLVRLYELFADDDLWFFTMDLIEGERFDRVFSGASGDDLRFRDALTQLVSAVTAIHRAGKLHRDLKPSNVLVEPGGRVVVLDFGLVSDPEYGGILQTVTEPHLIGTPAYMAPEQAAGKYVTSASDWYALGVMLFEVLTGRLPFEGHRVAILMAKQHQDAPDPGHSDANGSSDLMTLCRRLLARNPALRPDGVTLMAQLGTPVPLRSSPALAAREAPVPLLGRAAELDALHAAYRASLSGHKPVIVMLTGDSGMGKTALMAQFIHELSEGTAALLLQGRCYERETVPYKAFDVIVDELSRHLRRLPAEQAAVLTPREAWALTRLFPVLGRIPVFADAPDREGADPHEVRRRGFIALGEVLGRLRDRRPLVLHIDDLQWTDADSVRLLTHLLRQGEAPRLLFVGSHQNGQQGLISELYDALSTDVRVDFRETKLTPLTLKLATQIAGPHVPRQLVESAGGNPFLLRALAERARERGLGDLTSATLSDVLFERHAALPPDAQRLLQVIALAAGPIPADVAASAAQADRRALDTLSASQLVRTAFRRAEVECYHSQIRMSVVGAVPPDHATALHRRIVEAWQAQSVPDAERLVFHCEAAGEHQKAAEYAAEAALRAAKVLGFERAAALYAIALRLGTFAVTRTRELHIAHAEVLAQAGRSVDAAEICVAAMEGAPPGDAADLARRAGGFYVQSGRLQEGIPLVNSGLSQYGLRLPHTEQGRLAALALERARLGLRGYRPRQGRSSRRAVERFEAAEAIAYALPQHDPLCYAGLATHLVRTALDSGDATLVARAMVFEVWSLTILGASKRKIDAVVARAEALCRDNADPFARFWLSLSRGNAAIPHDASEALVHNARAQEALTACPHPHIAFLAPAVAWQRQYALCLQGAFRGVARDIPALLDDAWARNDLGFLPFLAGVPGAIARVAVEDLVALRRDLLRVRSAVAHQRFSWQDIMLAQGDLIVDLYEGDVVAAQGRVQALQAKLRGLWVRHVTPVRAYVLYLDAWAKLAIARGLPEGTQRAALLGDVERGLKLYDSLAAMAGTWPSPLAPALKVLQGNREGAVASLKRLVLQEEAIGRLPVYAACASRALGTLVGGDEGRALVVKADAFFRTCGVVDPVRFVAATAPGLA